VRLAPHFKSFGKTSCGGNLPLMTATTRSACNSRGLSAVSDAAEEFILSHQCGLANNTSGGHRHKQECWDLAEIFMQVSPRNVAQGSCAFQAEARLYRQ
jgi:hypothetical protein